MPNKLAIIVAHAGADSLQDALVSWGCTKFIPWINNWCAQEIEGNHAHVGVFDGQEGMLRAYELGRKLVIDAEILAFFHDDLIIKEPWLERVLEQFEDDKVGLVGFGGALIHGTKDLYKKPYDFHQLGRDLYRSNVDDAEVHGERFKGVCDVAVLDGFSLIVRRSILDSLGGWPVELLDYSLYDYWLSCATHRLGYRIRLIGVRCHHLGGRTAVALKKAEGCGEKHELAHKYIYDEFRDVLPWNCSFDEQIREK